MNELLLNWAVLAVSFFNTISLLWLGLVVLLAGNRRSAGAWLTGGGLLLGALFFTSHTAILGRGLSSTSLGMDFWWWVSWCPAVIAPLAWYGAMLWYAGYRFDRPHRHHAWVALVLGLALAIALLLVFANPLPTYQSVAGRSLVYTPAVAGIPVLILCYVLYSLLCYLLPLDLLRRPRNGSALETRSRQQARPWLVSASAALLIAGILLAWTAFWAVTTRPTPSLEDPAVERTVKLLDLAVAGLVAAGVTLLGRAVVGFEVFTGRPLPRNRLFHHWRSTVILAAGFGAVAAWTLASELRPIYSLMLATGLMTLFYALYSWRTFTEREEFMERLRPFVASQNLYGQLTRQRAGEEETGAQSATDLFETLCRQVLEVRTAALAPAGALATLAGPPLVYPPGAGPIPGDPGGWPGCFTPQVRCVPAGDARAPGWDWAVPLWSSRGLDGVLLLGEKTSGSPFTEEEIQLAQAAGERVLDLLAGTEMARLAVSLLRQRLAEARVLQGQGRRVLHDEVLPDLHTTLLYLSGIESPQPEVRQAVQSLAGAHRRISDLMRDLPLPTPNRLAQQGLAAALQALLENEFAGSFAQASWAVDPEAAAYSRELPLFINEVLFYAARELVRNAAEHGQADGRAEKVCLSVRLERADGLRLTIEDNGSGFRPETASGRDSDSGGGLRIHSAMLAAVGGKLEITRPAGGGTKAVITLWRPPSLVTAGYE